MPRKTQRSKPRAPQKTKIKTRKRQLAVIGIGNPLMGDDGAGIQALELLTPKDLPKNVKIVDAGTGGMSLLHILSNYDAVVIADAVDMGLRPGEVKAFSPNDVISLKNTRNISTHETDILQILTLAQQLQQCPGRITICAIQPKLIAQTTGLSTEIRKRIPDLIALISSEIWKYT